MDIASLSTEMSMERVQNAVSLNLLKKVMNQEEQSMAFITDSIQKSNPVESVPSFGHTFDVRA